MRDTPAPSSSSWPFAGLYSVTPRLFNNSMSILYWRAQHWAQKTTWKHCWSPGLNQGPLDLQSNALPAELLQPCPGIGFHKTCWNTIIFQLFQTTLADVSLWVKEAISENRIQTDWAQKQWPSAPTQAPCQYTSPLYTCMTFITAWFLRVYGSGAGKQNRCSWKADRGVELLLD